MLAIGRLLVFGFLLVMSVPCTVFAACLTSSGEKAVSECSRELEQDQRNLELRYRLADALNKGGKKEEAIRMLRQGIALFSDNPLRQSELEEKIQFISRQAGTAVRGSGAQDSVNLILCKSSVNLEACNKALEKQPDNVDLLVGKGKALMAQAPPKTIEAIKVLDRAVSIDGSNQQARVQLAAAQKSRQRSVDECLNTAGRSGYNACVAGLLPGANDEATIRARSGELLSKLGQKDLALKEYRAALKREPGNSKARQGIAALTVVAAPEPVPSSTRAVPVEPVYNNAPLDRSVTY